MSHRICFDPILLFSSSTIIAYLYRNSEKNVRQPYCLLVKNLNGFNKTVTSSLLQAAVKISKFEEKRLEFQGFFYCMTVLFLWLSLNSQNLEHAWPSLSSIDLWKRFVQTNFQLDWKYFQHSSVVHFIKDLHSYISTAEFTWQYIFYWCIALIIWIELDRNLICFDLMLLENVVRILLKPRIPNRTQKQYENETAQNEYTRTHVKANTIKFDI